jgi:hypothetical protein
VDDVAFADDAREEVTPALAPQADTPTATARVTRTRQM